MKIGILTMHKVLNYGSALQAYALLRTVQKLGFDAELVDYYFPNRKAVGWRSGLVDWLKRILTGRFVKVRRFKLFYSRYYKCSKQSYFCKEDLWSANLDYDILMTGSDQVWNPVHVEGDYSFFLPFAKEGVKKVSYAASFAVSVLPSELKPIFSQLLSSYADISVRETSGVGLVGDLLPGRRATVVCDPTLLMSGDEWAAMIAKYSMPLNRPYILAYILQYSYNPYPEIYDIIDFVQKKLGYHVVMLDGRMRDVGKSGMRVVKTAGPLEFLNWVKHASFVVTTSFHGSAFALNFNRPFLSVIKDWDYVDSRMIDFLERFGCHDNVVTYKQDLSSFDFEKVYHSAASFELDDFRNLSMAYLKSALS